MTEDDKALVERLRDDDSYYRIQEKHWCIDAEELERQRLAAADRIEQLTAENERLREVGTKLAGFAAHDIECEDVTGAYPGSCSCGYASAWRAWSAALEAQSSN